ncbi:MAG TPA: response regulator transcription factor [Flavobacteriales bacterium]|nr:response regulator transcription factor [Flavobacteriales bacterium]
MSTIKILVVDDHSIFTDGMQALLATVEGFEIAGAANNADEAIQKAMMLKPDVMLMDIQMPGKNGIEATIEIKRNNQDIKIIALSSANETLYIKKMLEAGASGYVLKNIDKDELVLVIKKVHAGEKHLDGSVANQLIEHFNTKPTEAATLVDTLTKREKEILAFIAQGLTDKEIADKVFLSSLTVISHRKNILSKLGLKNKVEIARFAIENKLI